LATSLSKNVFPVLGCATISPLCALPIGEEKYFKIYLQKFGGIKYLRIFEVSKQKSKTLKTENYDYARKIKKP
jgi:hypothetical protein